MAQSTCMASLNLTILERQSVHGTDKDKAQRIRALEVSSTQFWVTLTKVNKIVPCYLENTDGGTLENWKYLSTNNKNKSDLI